MSFYEKDSSFWSDVPRFHLGGPEPSTIISPHLLARELLWALGQIERDIAKYEEMSEDQRRSNNELWAIGGKCVAELLKFIPSGSDQVPSSAFTSDEARAVLAAHPEVFERTLVEDASRLLDGIRTELERVWKIEADKVAAAGVVEPPKPIPLPPFSLAALKFHEKWLAEGDVEGAQRMTGKGVDINGRNLADRDLSRVEVQHINVDRANLKRSQWREASRPGPVRSVRRAVRCSCGVICETRTGRGAICFVRGSWSARWRVFAGCRWWVARSSSAPIYRTAGMARASVRRTMCCVAGASIRGRTRIAISRTACLRMQLRSWSTSRDRSMWRLVSGS